MKILLNGATAGTNFGDFLFAYMFQEYLMQHRDIDEVLWYSSKVAYSDFFASHLKNNRFGRIDNVDGLVSISGGYFAGDDKRLWDYVLRYFRYFAVIQKCILRRKPYGIFGIEVAHSKSWILDRIQRYLLRRASVVVVRNTESFAVAKEYGVENLICTADSVFALRNEVFQQKIVPAEIESPDRKLLLFHVRSKRQDNISLNERLIPAVNEFLAVHKDYGVVLTTDQYGEKITEELKFIAQQIRCDWILLYNYEDPLALCKVIDCADLVVTAKLHVGIVGAKLGKSVLSFSDHSSKISRFYAQIGEPCRSIPLATATKDVVLKMLNEYYDKPIEVPLELQEAAQKTFDVLDEFVARVKGD